MNLAKAGVAAASTFAEKASERIGSAMLREAAGVAEGAEVSAAKGGVYALRDAANKIVRTGRTNNLVRRAAEHLRDPAFKDLTFEALYETDSYAA